MSDEPRPSSRRLGRAAVAIIAIVLAIVVVIFVTYNISHYNQMKTDRATENGAAAAR